MYNIGKGIATVGIWAAVAYITGHGGSPTQELIVGAGIATIILLWILG